MNARHSAFSIQHSALFAASLLALSAASAVGQAPPGPSGSAYANEGSITFGPDHIKVPDGPFPAAGRPFIAAPGYAPDGTRLSQTPAGRTLAADGRGGMAAAVTPPPEILMSADAYRADAQLHDLAFVSDREGWAVGDRGVIWHTDDAGGHWNLQESGVTCPLYSVAFVSPQAGWAVGGGVNPFRPGSTGVLLSTSDGGRSWQRDGRLALPLLRQIRFVNERYGWAVGAPTAMYPTGVFWTESGGQNWQPLPGGRDQRWLTGSLPNSSSGVLLGPLGTIGNVAQGTIQPLRINAFGLRGAQRIFLAPPQPGWMVGDGGLVATTLDAARTWRPPPAPLPPEAQLFDLRALSVRGPQCWMAGSPGTRIFHTADAGRTWHACPTAQTLPLHALAMIDDQHGFAVGDLGTILATTDGGRSWHRQRGGGSRAAVLGLFSQPGDVPLELLARLAGNDGYLTVVDVVNRQDVETRLWHWADLGERLHEAVVNVGGSSGHVAWQFLLRQPGLGQTEGQIIDGWNATYAGHGREALEAYLVRQIRTWRPELVLTAEAGLEGDPQASRLVGQIVGEAVMRAGDPRYLPDEQAALGLAPWQPKKSYCALGWGVRGMPELTTAQLAPQLGRPLSDVAAAARGLICKGHVVAPSTVAFRLLQSNISGDGERNDFLCGINMAANATDARRAVADAPPEGFDLLSRMAQRRRNAQSILERAAHDPRGGTQLLAQTGDLLRGLDPATAAGLLDQLAGHYFHSGRWDLAAELYSSLIEHYPESPLSRPAELWLVQYYASGEAACRLQAAQRQSVQQASTWAVDEARPEVRAARAANLAGTLEHARPGLFAEPALQLSLAVAQRVQGHTRQVESCLAPLVRGGSHDVWWACAEGEHWLAAAKGPGPKAVLHCVHANTRPRLDGRLDEPFWKTAQAAPLHSAYGEDAPWPAEVKMAYDGENLYVAITCRQAPQFTYRPGVGVRPRDADLAAEDRVDLLLDIDRDFATYYHLAVDHRGWTSDDCWGDRTWDPAWFVASRSEGGQWIAEIAIPLDQLALRRPTAGDIWALGLQRIVPGVGFQSWNTPAAATIVPEGFGYLIFD